MIEVHPFGEFVPKNAKYLILGSFVTKEAFDDSKKYVWFYGSGRNQFWSILETIYKTELKTRNQMQELLTKLHMAMADIIYQCERKKGTNLDNNLINITYNEKGIGEILKNNKIEKIFFTSRFVEKLYRKNFKNLIDKYQNIELITLPSPSPRYAQMIKVEKLRRYKELLPKTG